MKVLFLVPYTTDGASNRVRVEQYLPYLEREGITYRMRPFTNNRFFRILYEPRRYAEKAFWFVICSINRILDLLRALKYDVIFIHREAYPFGGPFFESILRKMRKPIVFDFDDAIFLPNTSRENVYIERLKNPDKTARIIANSAHVIAGNRYLGDFALKFNRNVTIIPSCADTERYRPQPEKPDSKSIVIGWVGSATTRNFLYELKDVFEEIARRYDNAVFKFVGARFPAGSIRNIANRTWSLESEADEIQSFDIGIMPMPDNEWTRGKCGFKIILYMACGLPVVSSPVGVNKEIIREGVNGFLAGTNDEWIEKLSKLIEEPELRKSLGMSGRRTVEEAYSIRRYAPNFIKVLNDAKKDSYIHNDRDIGSSGA